ncbi:30S ribosomal protein S7 [Spirochaetota bacterium]|nr:30S ribosomal protein S7 [Spirochaetota bacterium]
MSRKYHGEKRTIEADVVFNSVLAARFINRMMVAGKKPIAEKIFYKAIDMATQKIGGEKYEMFEKAINNVSPMVEVKSRRVGGATYQVPTEVSEHRRHSLAIRWLITFARNRSEKGMVNRLAGELVDACNLTGGAFKKKEEVFRMAEANKAFSHYKW